MALQASFQPISIFWRLCIYGLLGFAVEVIFTAGWEFVVNLNLRFMGNTSLWSFIIYGLFGLFAEKLRELMVYCHIPLVIRALVLMTAAYVWEFTCGMILKLVGLNTWDYSSFKYNMMEVVTLEYAPAWYVGCLVLDVIYIPYIKQIYWGPEPERNNEGTKQVKREDTAIKEDIKKNYDTLNENN